MNMEEFYSELSKLLEKHNVAIIAKSNKDDDDFSVEIGFQFGMNNKWVGRHHVTGCDMKDVIYLQTNEDKV